MEPPGGYKVAKEYGKRKNRSGFVKIKEKDRNFL